MTRTPMTEQAESDAAMARVLIAAYTREHAHTDSEHVITVVALCAAAIGVLLCIAGVLS